MKSEQDVLAIVEELKKLYPDAICSLDYQKPHELLFATRLAAQCTDERVNKVTPGLYGRFPTLEALASADISEVEELIHSTGFFWAKARDMAGRSVWPAGLNVPAVLCVPGATSTPVPANRPYSSPGPR